MNGNDIEIQLLVSKCLIWIQFIVGIKNLNAKEIRKGARFPLKTVK